MKFSIIVPVYNLENYLEKCLKSIQNQDYENYEVIIVNDGSKDNSQKIIEKFTTIDKRFKCVTQQNKGVGVARNTGLSLIKGDYLIFVDGDDYIESQLLSKLNESLKKNPVDLLRYECNVVDDKYNFISKKDYLEFQNCKISEVISELVRRNYVETLWSYCFSIEFWKNNNFCFSDVKIHEDFGLMMMILSKCALISCINYHGYNYVQRPNSLTKTEDYEKIKNSIRDMEKLYLNLNDELKKEKVDYTKKVLLTYIAECYSAKGRGLKAEDYKLYINSLKKNMVWKNIYPYNFKKMIKRYVALISNRLYLKLFFND